MLPHILVEPFLITTGSVAWFFFYKEHNEQPSFCTALLVHVRLRRELGNIGSVISIACLHVFCMFFPTVELLRHPTAQLGVHMWQDGDRKSVV